MTMRHAHPRWLRAAALAVSCAAGCAPAQQGTTSLVEPSVDAYATYVHPIVEGTCATLDCHGQQGRPLRLFSETGLRMNAELRGRPEEPTMPVTADELAQNVRAVAGVDVGIEPGRVDERLLLRKPISTEGGGIHHEGGVMWKDGRDDVAYLCVRSWLVDAIDEEACAAASERDALPPK